MKVTVHCEKIPGERNCSCFIDETFDKCGLNGYGATVDAAIEDLKQVRKEYVDEGHDIPELEMTFKYDLWAFFDKFPMNITMVAKQIGVNPSLMRQYVSGNRKPSQKRIEEIQDGIREIGKSLSQVSLERF